MWKKITKAVLFLLIFILLFLGASAVLNSTGDYRSEQWIGGFYKEPARSLDAVYVGSSTCYAYWNPLYAWENYGIAVYPYTCNSQHFIAAEYLIREVRKTQPDALFIVNTNTIEENRMVVEKYHDLLDCMPLSINKLRLTKYLCDISGFSAGESLELYVPLYRFHSRWSELNSSDFYYPPNGLKGTSNYSTYKNTFTDITQLYTHADGYAPLPDYIAEAAVSLMDYCEAEGVRIVFVTVPRVETRQRLEEINTLNAMLEERGFDTLKLMDQTELLKLDLSQDFYNKGHTNIHGSIKYTAYLSEYLIERYGLSDRRGDPLLASWDEGVGKYARSMQTYTLDIERDVHHRTSALTRPEELQIRAGEAGVDLSWSPVAGAEGYLVFHRPRGKTWQLLAEVTDTRLSGAAGKETDDYTVVPFCGSGEDRLYGDFDYRCSPAEES